MPAFSRPALVLAGLISIGSASGLLLAQKAAPGQLDISRVEAGTYLADPAHTLVGWRINHMGFNDYFGIFGSIVGTLVIDPARPEAARVAVRIPIRKVTTASEGLNGHLVRPAADGGKPDYFGPKPADALFSSTRVVPGADGKSAVIEGKLTLNGVTRPVTLNAVFAGAGKNPLGGKLTIGFHATAAIKRSDFGLDADIPLVGDEVQLQISAGFERQK